MNAGQIIVIGLSAALLLWFAGGMWYNRRLARQIWGWMEPGLAVFGGQMRERWIGKSGAGLLVVIDGAEAPLLRVELVVKLLPRDNAPLWIVERVQGKQDQLTLRAWLRSPGRTEAEVVRVGSELYETLQRQVGHPWQSTHESSRWAIYRRGGLNTAQLDALKSFVDLYDAQLLRFSKRRTEPHLRVEMAVGGLCDASSQQLFDRYKATVGG